MKRASAQLQGRVRMYGLMSSVFDSNPTTLPSKRFGKMNGRSMFLQLVIYTGLQRGLCVILMGLEDFSVRRTGMILATGVQRAWTLQEVHAENMTFNGGMSQNAQGVLLNTRSKVGGEVTTLRHALLPVLKLTAELHSSSGYMQHNLQTKLLDYSTSCTQLNYQPTMQKQALNLPGNNVFRFFH